MTETVFVCYEKEPASKAHESDQWIVAGIVKEKRDAELWVEPDGNEEMRKYTEIGLNKVDAYYTQNLEPTQR